MTRPEPFFGTGLFVRHPFPRDGGHLRFDFETWLVQNYGLKTSVLTDEELELAKEEYMEEYPPLGEGDIKLKTYPFKRYLDSKK